MGIQVIGADNHIFTPQNPLDYLLFDDVEIDKEVDIVVSGMDNDYTYSKLLLSSLYVNELKNKLVATNDDIFINVNGRRYPCAGTLLATLMVSVQDKSALEVVGKPNEYGFKMIRDKFDLGKKRVLMVGDRPDTDIAFGNASKIDTCLVMTGIVKDQQDFEANWATR